MRFDAISTTWANLNKDATIIILTEADRWGIAEKIKQDNESLVSEIKLYNVTADDYKKQVDMLSESDLLIVMLTVKSFMDGYGEKFSPFTKSPGLKCKYIFIRLDIPEKALLSGLNTDFNKVEKIVADLKAIKNGSKVRVTTDKGMDITTCVNYQEIFAYSARDLGGNAFLPPSEVANDLFEDSTNGTIVADITVGEFRIRGELIY
jgi:hypothetical protein